MKKEIIKQLAAHPLFSDISAADIPHLLHCLGAYEKNYQKSEFLLLFEEPITWIGIILTGRVHIIKEDLWGNSTILAVLQPMDIFGESFACGSRKKSEVCVQAAEVVKVLILQFDKVIRTCSRMCSFHQQLTENMVSMIADKNLRLMEKIEITSKKTIREKICTYLGNQVSKENSDYITIPLGRLELAEYLCVDRSALTRELNTMKNEGLIDFHKNTFRILKELKE